MNLTPQRILAALALTAGIVLFIIGMNGSHTLPDQVSFADRFHHATTWFVLGGITAAMFGLYLLLTDLFTKRTCVTGTSRRYHRR
jgi:hypothetical protein